MQNNVRQKITRRRSMVFLTAILVMAVVGCNGAKEALDLADGPSRKPIDRSVLGLNAFFNDTRFGSIASQASDIQSNLRINRLRLLIRWDNGAQPSRGAQPQFPLLDATLSSLSAGTEVLVVTTGVPSWMSDQSNWIDGNPRTTFAEVWLRPLARHLAGRVAAIQVWNEPNSPSFSENATLNVLSSPDNYAELAALAKNVLDSEAPGIKFVLGSTTAINQNYPETLNYNKALRDAGVDSLVDVWGVHYYGQQFENLIRSGGVQDFLNGLSVPIWVTESGAQGVNEQLRYGEETWPYLREKVPGIDRIYIYQYAEASDSALTYGLKNLSVDFPVSDLYVWLRG